MTVTAKFSKSIWGDAASDENTLYEEIICRAVMAIPSDSEAMRTALGVEKNPTVRQKLANIIEKLANRIKEFISKRQNVPAKILLDDVEMLREFAKQLRQAADADIKPRTAAQTRQNEKTAAIKQQKNNITGESGVRYAKNDTYNKKARYAKQGGEWSKALTGAEWIKFNHAISTKMDAGLRVSENSILVECENNSPHQYKFVIYDNSFDDNPIKSIYAIGNIDYNIDDARMIAEEIDDLEASGYEQKYAKKILKTIAAVHKIILGKYNSKNSSFSRIGNDASKGGENSQLQPDGTTNITSTEQTKYSDRLMQYDRDYLTAVDRGDMKTAQRMVDEAAKAAGYSIRAYHGTSKGGFTVFDSYGGNFGLFGTGSYFTEDKSVAVSYTNKGKGNHKQVYDVFLNLKNPIDMDAKADVSEWIRVSEADETYFTDCVTNEDCFKALKEYCADEEMYRYEAEEEIMGTILGMGYDSITHIGGGRFNKKDTNRHRVWIAFDPEQVKSADPVTYDDNGNVIPLSERFNTENPDIRYAKDDTALSDGSDILYAMDDTLTGDLFDLGEEFWADENKSVLERTLKNDPRYVATSAVNSMVKTAGKVFSAGSGVTLDKRHWERIAKRIMRKYEIRQRNESTATEKITETVRSFAEGVQNANAGDINGEVETLVSECRQYVEMSGDYRFDNEYIEGAYKSLRGGMLGKVKSPDFVKFKNFTIFHY